MKTAMQMVVRMKVLEERTWKRRGGGVVESRRAPERKLLMRPIAMAFAFAPSLIVARPWLALGGNGIGTDIL